MHIRNGRRRTAFLGLLAAGTLAGCSNPLAPAPTATPSATASTVSVYFLRDEKIAAAHRTLPATPADALAALVAGPTTREQATGLSSAIPVGTRVLGITTAGDVATVNLTRGYESGGGSLSMAARLAQVVFTVTQFPGLNRLQFQLEGQPVQTFGGEGLVLDHPVGRAGYEELTPAIFVESPAVGDRVKSPLQIWGTANVFEAVFRVRLTAASGQILAEQMVTATSGTGTRGSFDVSLAFSGPAGAATLRLFSESPKDGSPINVVEIPIQVDGA